MTPVPAVQYRSAYIDRAERFEVRNPLIAGTLMALGHEVLGVIEGRLLFRKAARADFQRINLNADEARALLERAHTHSSTSKGQGHGNADRQQ
jgi:hypothetical protein